MRKIEKEANTIDYRPVRAEVLYLIAKLLHYNGESEKAETAMYAAALYAGENKDGLLAAQALVKLVWIVGFSLSRPDAGLDIGRAVEVLISLQMNNKSLLSNLYHGLAVCFLGKGDYNKSLVYNRKSLMIRKEILEPDHPEIAMSLNNISIVLQKLERVDEALESLQMARQIWEREFGPDHPLVAASLINLATNYSKKEQYDKALELYNKALEIWERSLGTEHPHLAHPLNNIGMLLVDQGRPEQALGPLERAVGLCEKKICDQEPNGTARYYLARALVAISGDKQRAINLSKQARSILGKTPKKFKKELEEVDVWMRKYDKGKKLSVAKQ